MSMPTKFTAVLMYVKRDLFPRFTGDLLPAESYEFVCYIEADNPSQIWEFCQAHNPSWCCLTPSCCRSMAVGDLIVIFEKHGNQSGENIIEFGEAWIVDSCDFKVVKFDLDINNMPSPDLSLTLNVNYKYLPTSKFQLLGEMIYKISGMGTDEFLELAGVLLGKNYVENTLEIGVGLMHPKCGSNKSSAEVFEVIE